jgi:dihydrofolate synthase / folylpolyglutamate synthase
MTYQQTLDYLFTRLPMFSRIGAAAYKADLDNTIRLCDFLGNPQYRFQSIHIAGTNGKGSTSHLLAAILQQAGYKTGLYTSPHLQDFRERIKINGQMIPEAPVVDFVARTKDLSEAIQPSFFELTVAMAFEYFAAEKVDIAIIETGLGGRLDSTNVITPLLSLITNISFDHINLLGNTLPAIAFEKAGIIKQGVPAIIGEVQPDTWPVFAQKANSMAAPLYQAGQHYAITDFQYVNHLLQVTVAHRASGQTQPYLLDLPGLYQTRNLPAVLLAVELLRQQGFDLPGATVAAALQQVKKLTGLHGRWELIQENPMVILDVGHNEAGIKAIVEQLAHTPHRQLHLVMGMVKDKEVEKVLSLLPTDARYYFTQAAIPRALPAEDLLQKAVAVGLQGIAYSEVNEALAAAKAQAQPEDLVLVCGSVFIVGEVKRVDG